MKDKIIKILNGKSKNRYSVSKTEAGFTLIETLVSVFIFSVIMMIAAGSLLTIINANTRTQQIKTAVTNVGFAIETVSNVLMIADKISFQCFNLPTEMNTCDDGVSYAGISFDINVSGETKKYYFYVANDSNLNKGRIYMQKGGESFDNTSKQPITPESVSISSGLDGSGNPDYKIFHIKKTTPLASDPFYNIKIALGGDVAIRGITTKFSLQTGVVKLGI